MKTERFFRYLKPSEIEVKVNTVKAKGAQLMLYKTSRTDFQLLTEKFGLGWTKRHWIESDGTMWCEISVYDEEHDRWITRSDVGTEDNSASANSSGAKEGNSNLAVKTRVSDSVKRCGFAFGIGVELYNSPFIWVPANKCEIVSKGNGKYACYDQFAVKEIECEGEMIVKLVIVNARTGAVVYTYGTTTQPTPAPTPEPTATKPVRNIYCDPESVIILRSELEERKIPESFVLSGYKINDLMQLTAKQMKCLLDNLDKVETSYKKTQEVPA